jgi:hypothetical protein
MATNYVPFDVIVSAVASVHASRVAALKQIADKANITQDKQGRFHAPHDGFVWSDGMVYQAGEYLPDYDGAVGGPAGRAKFTCVSSAECVTALRKVGFTFGAAYTRNDATLVNAYFEGRQSEVDAINSLIPANKKVLSHADQADGTVWETTLGKLHDKWAKTPWCDYIIDDALLTAMVEWKDAKAANPKHKAVKLSVGYAYTETLVK